MPNILHEYLLSFAIFILTSPLWKDIFPLVQLGVTFQKSQVIYNWGTSLYGKCQLNLFLQSPELLLHSDLSKSLEIKTKNLLKDNRMVLSIFGIKKLLLCLLAAKICQLGSYITKEITPWFKKRRECQIPFSRPSHNQIPFFTVFCNPSNWDHPKCYHELKSVSIKNPIYIPCENTWPSKVFDFYWTFSSVCYLKCRPCSIFLSNAASYGNLVNELAK